MKPGTWKKIFRHNSVLKDVKILSSTQGYQFRFLQDSFLSLEGILILKVFFLIIVNLAPARSLNKTYLLFMHKHDWGGFHPHRLHNEGQNDNLRNAWLCWKMWNFRSENLEFGYLEFFFISAWWLPDACLKLK